MSAPLTDAEPASGAPPAGSIPLHPRSHEDYARERALAQPITHAAARAGLSKRSGAGSKIEALEEVQLRIAWLAREDEDILREKRRRIEERQWLISDMDLGHFYESVSEPVLDEEGNPKLNKKGKPILKFWERLKPFEKLTPEQRLCIHSLSYTEKGKPNLKLYDKQEASKALRQMLGLDAPTKIAPSNVAGDGPAEIEVIERVIIRPGDTAPKASDPDSGSL